MITIFSSLVIYFLAFSCYSGSLQPLSGTGNIELNHTQVLRSIVKIIDIMSWQDIVIVHDEIGSGLLLDFFNSAETKYIKVAIFNVDDWKGNHSGMLLTIHERYFPNISILVFGGEHALQVVNTVNTIDEKSNRTTDFRHKSKWVIVPRDNSCVPVILNLTEFVLENILVLSKWQANVEVFTFALSRREFVHVESFTKTNLFPNTLYGFNGRHFIITSHVSPQFFLKDFVNGSVVYSGYAKTFSDAMSTFLNFTYTFVEPEDNQWGNLVNGTWDGLIGQLIRREVDMAVAELTMTQGREEVVDFLLPPFFTQGMGMVFKKEDDLSKGWSTILQPFQLIVYYTIIAAAVGFCFIMYILEKVNPRNKRQVERLSLTSECVHMANIFISVVGCFCCGGDGIRPRTWTGRILTSSLWLCCIVLAATYSGNLTASLSVRREKKPFNSLEELITLPEWKWGIHPATLTAALFRESKRDDMIKTWQKILEFNRTEPIVLSTKTSEHIERALGGKYAYITLDPLLFKLSRNDCLLDTVTNVLSTQHVALAVPTDSPLKPEIQRFIYHLFDGGVLKRWEESRYEDKRPKECLQPDTSSRAMYLDDIKGAFAALGFGVALAALLLACENVVRRMISDEFIVT